MIKSTDIIQFIKELEQLYAPDKRTEVFNFTVHQSESSFVVEGETSSREAYDKLTEQLYSKAITFVRLLPDEVVGQQQWGIIYNMVQKMHLTNSFRSETVTELLMGTPVKILDQRDEWRRVQAPNGYIGWVPDALATFTENEFEIYNLMQKVIVTVPYTFVYQTQDKSGGIVSNLVMGSLLAIKSETDFYFQVMYPDGRKGYVWKGDVMLTADWYDGVELTKERIVEQAKQLMGVPYVWGGTSVHGLDCSGLTKLVYYMNGVVLPRDASQQVKCGELVDDRRRFKQLEPGDLIFFGEPAKEGSDEKVVHVAISLGGDRFIHASDYVRVNSFNPEDSLYDAFNTHRYLRTKRIIGVEGSGCYTDLADTPFYHTFFK